MSELRIVCLVYADEKGTMDVIDAENVKYVLDRIGVQLDFDSSNILLEMVENQKEENESPLQMNESESKLIETIRLVANGEFRQYETDRSRIHKILEIIEEYRRSCPPQS